MTTEEAIKLLRNHYNSQLKKDFNELSQNWFQLKYRHSLMVYEAMRELISNDINFKDLPQENKEELLIVAILHDVGRFYQMETIL